MKAKFRVLLTTIMVTIVATSAYSQENKKNEGNVQLDIKLHPIQTLTVNTNQTKVELEYNSVDDYSKGVTQTLEEHFTVTSTGGYIINVKAEDFKYTTENEGLNKIGLSHITLDTTGESNDKNYTSLNGLQKNDQSIVTSNFGGIEQKFNVTYGAKGDNEYLINNYVKGKTQHMSTTITYTICPN